MIPLAPLLAFLDVKKIISFVIKNWREVLVGTMAFTIWYQNFNETRFLFGAETIPSLEKRLDGATNAVKICKAGNDTLSAAIDERNTEVEKWKQVSKDLEGDIAILQTDLDDARAKTNTEVEVILKDEAPKTCKAAINYLRDGRKDLQWKN
jgi:chromosome segregation ATPase